MNRYVAQGVAADLVVGRHVVVAANHAQDALTRVLDKLQGAPITINRGLGRERITHPSGGWVVFVSARSRTAGRGLTADVLVLEEGLSPEHRQELLPIAMRGEVIE